MLNKCVNVYAKIPNRFWEVSKKILGEDFLTHTV